MSTFAQWCLVFVWLTATACSHKIQPVDDAGTGQSHPDSVPLKSDSAMSEKTVEKAWQFGPPEEISTNVRLSEKFARQVTQKLKGLCRPAGIDSRFTPPHFRGRWGRISSNVRLRGVYSEYALLPGDVDLSLTEFNRSLTAMTSTFQNMTRCKAKISDFRLAKEKDAAFFQADLSIEGRSKQRQRRVFNVSISGVVEPANSLFRGIRLQSGTLRTTEASGFVDVSAPTGINMYRSAQASQILAAQRDAGLVQTVGGIGVIDWNQDGFDDLFAWDVRRTLTLFVNDGRGGFLSRADLVDPEAVGLHMLSVDLNDDGRAELISSQLVGCEDGQAWFGFFERRKDRFVPLGRKLVVQTSCQSFRRHQYQHIAVDDVDGDGDLDVFFAGFESAAFKRSRGNVYQGEHGLGNLLFINDGGLRFREVAHRGGFAGNDYTYVAKFFDLNDDDRRDLITINDYGVNRVYLNRGQGRFEAVEFADLTDNGQSMGLSIADFDSDGQFELYVSNMYSYAGNRIVPLARQVLDADTYDTLLRLAGGNTLYKRENGRYRDVAASMGLAKAKWAWGQAVFDADNDGDLDVYVANGNATHSDARAPDY
ncbi:MAG: FG-GAP repeat domain-containing protein [Bradymonadia bacterium]